jgi:hypothetical protein
MSLRGPGQQRSAFSFQTAYDQLAVEEGENTSSEEEEETPAPASAPDASMYIFILITRFDSDNNPIIGRSHL